MAEIFRPPFFQPDSINGIPLAGAKLYFYTAGTTTKITIYQDYTATTPHANPVVADASGIFPAIYVTDTLYKIQLYSALDLLVKTYDNISEVNSQIVTSINYFDYVPFAKQSGIAAGTDSVTDQYLYWKAFRDALSAASSTDGTKRVVGIIPQCTIYTSAAPNFAISFCAIQTVGLVTIICTGSDPGFKCDGTGLGTGAGVIEMYIGPIRPKSTTGTIALDIKFTHQSVFDRPTPLGATGVGSTAISFLDCVSSVMFFPNTSQMPAVTEGLFISGTGTAGGNTIIHPVIEGASNGLHIGTAVSTTIVGGVAENNAIGLLISPTGSHTTVIGMDIEANSSVDVYVTGYSNSLVGMTVLGTVQFDLSSAKANKMYGGAVNAVVLAATTSGNLIDGVTLNLNGSGGTISDSGTANRIANCIDGTSGVWFGDWAAYTPTVSSSAGTLTTKSAVGRYRYDGDDVEFTLEATITTNGTGSGQINITLPFVSNSYFSFTGQEIVNTGNQLVASVFGTSGSVGVRYYNGTYPGADGNILLVTGRYQRA